MPLEDFTVEQELGKGSFGTVHKCRRKADGLAYAIKQVRMDKLKQKDRVNALNEIRILASVVHPNVVEYKEAFYDEATSMLCIVMQFAEEGDLESKVKTHVKKGTRFEENEVWRTAFDLLQGLKKLHDCKIIHRDLKSANIFYSGGKAKLGDLNISKILKDEMAKTQTGTPYYACPEVWSDTPYGPKSDIWSLGCVLYEMCCLKPPFRASNFEGLYKRIMGGQYDKIPLNYSSQLSQFISRCLTVSEKKRAGVQELLDFKIFKQLKLTIGQEDANNENQMWQTIELPKNYRDLNGKLPTSKYEAQQKEPSRGIFKTKTVAIIEECKEGYLQREEVNISRKRLPSISRIRSEKCLPSALPFSTKVLPAGGDQRSPTHLQPLGEPRTPNLPSMKRIESSKGLRIHKPLRSQKLLQLD